MSWQYHEANPDSQPGPNFVAMNKGAAMTRREEFEEAHEKIEPMSTRASVGHAMNSAKAVEAQREPFKLKKFGKVTSKVSTRR